MLNTAEKITVIGAGSWGSALAMVLADNGHEVILDTYQELHYRKILKAILI